MKVRITILPVCQWTLPAGPLTFRENRILSFRHETIERRFLEASKTRVTLP
jgi:hypothetical protein